MNRTQLKTKHSCELSVANNKFNFIRFGKVVQKDVADRRISFLLAFLLVFVLSLVALYLVNKDGGYGTYTEYRFMYFLAILIGSLVVAPFVLYRQYNHRVEGVLHFMYPASQMEKYLSMFFHCIISTAIVTLAAFVLADLCLYPFYPWPEKQLWLVMPLPVDGHQRDANYIFYIIIMMLSLQAISFLCNIWFQRNKLLKTAICMVVIMLFIFYKNEILNTLFPIDMHNLQEAYKTAATTDDPVQVYGRVLQSNSALLNICQYSVSTVTAIGAWFVSFLKMKEQEL